MPAFYDAEAEKAVIACCLQAVTARAKAREHLSREDFFSPFCQALWVAMEELDASGKAVDPVSVMSAVNGNPSAMKMLTTIVSSIVQVVPDTVTTHAENVRQWAVRRRLHDEGVRLQQMALAPGQDPYLMTSQAVTRLTELRDTGITEAVQTRLLADLLAEADEPYDWIIPSLMEKGDRFVLTGQEGLGKQVPLDTLIPTPTGWTTMGKIAVGDELFAQDGTVTRVIAKSEPEFPVSGAWRITFHDGVSVVADGNHQWVTTDYAARGNGGGSAVRTTDEIRRTLTAYAGRTNHSVEAAGMLDLPEADLPLDPYTLGVWLGDGTATDGTFTIADRDAEIIDGIVGGEVKESRNSCSLVRVPGLRVLLREMGLLGFKHIPDAYLRGSIEQRKALLAGICDTDGYCPDAGGKGRGQGWAGVEVVTIERELALGVMELCSSLGMIPKMYEGRAMLDGKDCGPKFRVYFSSPFNPFRRSAFKRERWFAPRTARSSRRFIKSVERVPDVLMQCLQVEHPSGTYLIGEEMVVTHNSFLARQIGIFAAAGLHPFTLERIKPIRCQVLDYENSWKQIKRGSRRLYDFADRHGSDLRRNIHVASLKRIDITRDRDLSMLHREVDAARPDVIIVGPLYRLTSRAIQTDDEAAPVLSALDTLRDRGCSLIIEAHAGHGKEAGEDGRPGERDLRPRGSSALLGWPEFGYGMRRLKDDRVRLVPWRGDRDERGWPQFLRRAKDPGSSHYLPDGEEV